MRVAGCGLAGWLILAAGCFSAAGEEAAAEKPKEEAKNARQYSIQVRFIGDGMNDLTSPEVIVKDGEKKLLADTESKTFVIGKKTGKANPPAKRDLSEGISMEAVIQETEENQAILDLSVELSCIDRGDVKKSQVRWNAERFRVLDCITPGQKTIAEFGHFSLEIMIKDVPGLPPQAASQTASTSATPSQAAPSKSE